jgi:hypothetical protein
MVVLLLEFAVRLLEFAVGLSEFAAIAVLKWHMKGFVFECVAERSDLTTGKSLQRLFLVTATSRLRSICTMLPQLRCHVFRLAH